MKINSNTNRYHVKLGLAVSLAITFIGAFTVYTASNNVNHTSVILIGISRFIFSYFLWLLYVPVNRFLKNKLLSLLIYLIIGTFSILPLVTYNQWINEITGSFYPPFEDPTEKTNPQEQLFWSYIWRGVGISLLLFVIHYREDLLRDKQQYQLANEKLRNQNLTHQLEVLKQQIDPHFLFNTLNGLRTLIKPDPDKAEKYAIEISNVYRYLLRHNRNKTVPLKEELDFLKAYLSLLQLRFEDNLLVQIDIDAKLYQKTIFPLSLQLLVENAVKHNIVTKDSPLQVHIYSVEEAAIVVENIVQLRSFSEGVSQYGLAHLSKLYRLHYDKDIEITNTSDIFKVRLPLI